VTTVLPGTGYAAVTVVSIGRSGAAHSNGEPVADEFVANGFAPDTVLVRTNDSAGTGAVPQRSVAVFCWC
jgi:hypothetical protein